jgi:hypothetical protein
MRGMAQVAIACNLLTVTRFSLSSQILPNVSSAPYPMTPSPLPDSIRGSMVRSMQTTAPPPPFAFFSNHHSVMFSLVTTPLKVEIIFDQTLLRSASSTVYSAGLLTDSITPSDFPKLNTSNFCFFSPALCQQYPDEGILLSIAAADAPLIDVNFTGISVFLNASLNFSANSSSGTSLSRNHVAFSPPPTKTRPQARCRPS